MSLKILSSRVFVIGGFTLRLLKNQKKEKKYGTDIILLNAT